MKKLFLVSALALSSLFASAQEGLQGVWFAGGNVHSLVIKINLQE